MINFSRRRNQALLAIIAVALGAVAAYTRLRPPLVPPFDVAFVSPMYLPAISKGHRSSPDSRFGIAEYTAGEADLLGLGDAHFIAGHWRLPLEGDTAVFLHPAERAHWGNFLLCSWSVADDDWYDEVGCRRWARDNPGMIYVIGNELSSPAWLGGDGDWIDTSQYARWYHETWTLIKAEDPAALVAPYGPVGGAGGLLIAVWESYMEQFGEPMPVDFYPVHHYCVPGEAVDWCWTKLTNWMNWLESHRGTYWSGPKSYWLTEWGLPAWAEPAPNALFVMEEMILRIRNSDISQHAWWPSCNSGWPDACTLLIRNGQVTELGVKYLELANE